MANDTLYSRDAGAQFVLSPELLTLLQWLIERHQDDLEALVHKAISSGLDKELKKKDRIPKNDEALEEIQDSIVDFFTALEVFILEAVHAQVKKRAKEKDLLPTLEHIDKNLYDTATMQTSLEHAADEMDRKPGVNPKELLFKELLKRWRPNKNSGAN